MISALDVIPDGDMTQNDAVENTVPKTITATLRLLCTALCNGAPILIPSTPFADARMSYCFENVDRMAQKHGGSAVAGWALWHKPGIYYEAEMHCVWRNPANELIDVSPQFLNPSHILFVTDPEIRLDPDNPVANRFFADSETPTPLVIEYVRIAQQRVDIYNRNRIGFPDHIVLSDTELAITTDIENRMLAIESILDAVGFDPGVYGPIS